MDEIAANAPGSPLLAEKKPPETEDKDKKDKELLEMEHKAQEGETEGEEGEEKEEEDDESRALLGHPAPLTPLPVPKTLRDVLNLNTNQAADPDRYDDTTTVVLQLRNTEDMLQRHIKGFKFFQLFVVIAIVLLCVIVIIMAAKFPAAVAPSEHAE